MQVKIAAAIEVNQATIARFEDGISWPRKPEEVLMAYASELEMDVRLLWLHAFVLWLEHDPVLDERSQEEIRAALKRLRDLGRRDERFEYERPTTAATGQALSLRSVSVLPSHAFPLVASTASSLDHKWGLDQYFPSSFPASTSVPSSHTAQRGPVRIACPGCPAIGLAAGHRTSGRHRAGSFGSSLGRRVNRVTCCNAVRAMPSRADPFALGPGAPAVKRHVESPAPPHFALAGVDLSARLSSASGRWRL